MKMTRKFLGAALLCAAPALLFSCGGKEGSSSLGKAGTENEPGWKLNAESPVTFDWYINFSWFARHWGDSKVSRYITDKTGVNINFIVPAGNEAEKLNAMIAGDAMPDIITLGWYEAQVPMMIDSELVEPLDELAKKYDPYFFKVASKEKLNWYTQDDGHVYGYPNASFTPEDYVKYGGKLVSNETFLVRKDMYEALGKPDMTTPDGFLRALREAKKRFQQVNGAPLIPFGTQEFSDAGNTQLQGVLSHFLALDPERDGKYEDPNLGLTDNPEYVRWLKTLRQAYGEGLIPTDIFVDKRSQIEEKAAQGRYFCMLYQNWDMQSSQHALYAKDPQSIYIAVDGPKNSRGDDPRLAGGSIAGWTVTMISKKCRDKARAIQLMTYMISEEGLMDLNFGIPGETYEITGGKPELLPQVKELDANDKNKQETDIGVQFTYWMLMDTAWQNQWGIEYAPSLEQPQLWTSPYVTSYAVYDGLTLPAGSDEDIIYQDIVRRWGKTLPALIRASSDAEFDSLVQDFNAYKKDHGYDKIQKAQTELMMRNKKKLGG